MEPRKLEDIKVLRYQYHETETGSVFLHSDQCRAVIPILEINDVAVAVAVGLEPTVDFYCRLAGTGTCISMYMVFPDSDRAAEVFTLMPL